MYLMDSSYDTIGFLLGIFGIIPFLLLAGIGLQRIVDSNKILKDNWATLVLALCIIAIPVAIYLFVTDPISFLKEMGSSGFNFVISLLVVYIINSLIKRK